MLIDHTLRVTCFDLGIGVEDILKEPTRMHSSMLVLREAQNIIGGIMSMNAPKCYTMARSMAAPNSAPNLCHFFLLESDLYRRLCCSECHLFRKPSMEIGLPERGEIERNWGRKLGLSEKTEHLCNLYHKPEFQAARFPNQSISFEISSSSDLYLLLAFFLHQSTYGFYQLKSHPRPYQSTHQSLVQPY